MARVILALGTNLGDRTANLRRARQALESDFELGICSRIYETQPAYVRDQPLYYNQVCLATTQLRPLEVLHRLKWIESEMGRVPGVRYGPRLIDLDLLFYDDLVMDGPDLVLPHPRIAERAFVLAPLAEVAPDLVHPRLHLTVAQLLARLGDTHQAVWPVEA
jgi:2-amino-4-hydroxy-6-hydroxymethyldihydropteridine diphosphokinase